MESSFHVKLKSKMDEFVHLVYSSTKNFPKEELYGVTSQFRRAALSVVLNYIEGYARQKKLVLINFLQISFGSIKECCYLIEFSFKEGYLNKMEYDKLLFISDEISAMLWRTIENLEKK